MHTQRHQKLGTDKHIHYMVVQTSHTSNVREHTCDYHTNTHGRCIYTHVCMCMSHAVHGRDAGLASVGLKPALEAGVGLDGVENQFGVELKNLIDVDLK